MEKPKAKAGRPKLYDQSKPNRRGAPQTTIRFSPPIHEHIQKQVGGARTYLERLVTDDIERTKPK